MSINTLYVFDIDDTLTQTAKLHQDAFILALEQLGVVEMDTNFGAYKHHTDSYIARLIYEKDKAEHFDFNALSKFESILNKHVINSNIQEIKGAKAVIDQIENSDSMGICFATGSLLKPAQYKLEQIGIKDFESRLAASNRIEERENIVLAAIKKAKAYYQQSEFEQIISVGDGLWDLQTAKTLGVDFIGVGLKNQEILKKNGATTLLKDLSDFFDS